MNVAAMLFVIISSLLTILVAIYVFSVKKEGFSNAKPTEKPDRNVLLSLVGKLTRINKQLIDPTLWKDRIEMAFLSPTDLARRYIKQNKK